jgi:hypothetical protein
MPMKNSNDTIGNRSRDLPVCSAVPQPLRHRVPLSIFVVVKNRRENLEPFQFFDFANRSPYKYLHFGQTSKQPREILQGV